jgi:3-phosphoshikimate 1-carboxyvinyltransferase
MMNIQITKASNFEFKSIDLPGSKSESNRALIIQALAKEKITIEHLSNSEDTLIISNALTSNEPEINCMQSGAALRFLTAYYASQEGQERILTGSARLKERPMKPLIDALRNLGADIQYLEQEGYAPVKILGKKLQCKDVLKLDTELSSQFLTALLMIAPEVENGLRIEYNSELNSKPYVLMTIQMMQKAGIKVIQKNNLVHIPTQKYKKTSYQIESDWSAASY